MAFATKALAVSGLQLADKRLNSKFLTLHFQPFG